MNYDKNNELRVKGVYTPYVEESVLWYVFPFDEQIYLPMNIHQRINHKQRIINADFH